jgi:hypothetical protein
MVEDSRVAISPSICALPLRTGSRADIPDSANIDTQHQPSSVTDSAPGPEAGHSPSSSKPAASDVPSSYQELRCSLDSDDASSTRSFHSTVSYLEIAAAENPVQCDERRRPERPEPRPEQASACPSWSSVGLLHLHPMLRASLASQLGGNEPDIDSQRAPIAAPATSSVMEGADRSLHVEGVHTEDVLLTRRKAVAFLQRVSGRRLQQSKRSTTALEPNIQKGWDGLYGLAEDERSFSSTSDLVYDSAQEVVANMKHEGAYLDGPDWLAEMDKDGPIPEQYRPIPP